MPRSIVGPGVRDGATVAARLLILGVVAGLATPARGQAIDKQVLDQVKDATVYIKLSAGKMQASGSGFVIRAAGDTVLVMTNRHVAAPDPSELPGGAQVAVSVVFRSGTGRQQELPAKVLAFDEREVRDLAVLEVKGVTAPPRPILADQTSAESEFFETMPVYALGFPLGGQIQEVVDNRGANPAITVTPMSISSLRRDEANHLARVQLSGAMIGGNSGGPLVDAKGRLVGVAVSRLRNEAVGFAIPPSVIAGFLAGDIANLAAELVGMTGSSAQLKLAVRLVDPLNRLKGVALRFAPLSPAAGSLKPDAAGNWPQLPGGTNVALTLSGGTAAGQFAVPVPKPEDRKLLFQFVVTDSMGRTGTSKPLPTTLPDRPGPIPGLGEGQARAKTLARWSCEPNVGDGIKMTHQPGATTIDLPGGAPLVNAPQWGLFNAPSALVRVDGDFLAIVKVTNSFDPGGEGVVLPSGRKLGFSFQSAGLLIWQDDKNFIRLERVKLSNGGISLTHRILVEVYKGGKEAAVHYLDLPELPTALAAGRKGGSLQLLFAQSSGKMAVFQEMALDFNKEIFVGISAANLSRRPFQAKLEEFVLRNFEGKEYEAKPVRMAKLVDTGVVKLADGTSVIEGAALKVLNPQGAPAYPQDNMAEFKGQWSDDRQLFWNNDRTAQALTLEIPVDADGKYEIKAKFTLAPDYANAKLTIDGKPLNNGQAIDFYAQEIRPTKLMSLGTLPLNKGKRKLTITVFGKNAKSTGFHFGLDELQLVPAR